jgi:transcription elongation factor Elf1
MTPLNRTRKLNITFTNFKNLDNEVEIKCCGERMSMRSGKSKHHNDNPFTMKCKKCGLRFKCNAHFFTGYRHHGVIRIESIGLTGGARGKR